MSTHARYTPPVAEGPWTVPASGAARFSWEYDDGRERLLALYQKGKDKQWDQTKRIDWTLQPDPQNPLRLPAAANPLIGSDMWRRSPQQVKDSWRQHQIAWQFSQ